MSKLTEQQKARIREKSAARDGNGAYLRPEPGVYYTVTHWNWPSEHVSRVDKTPITSNAPRRQSF